MTKTIKHTASKLCTLSLMALILSVNFSSALAQETCDDKTLAIEGMGTGKGIGPLDPKSRAESAAAKIATKAAIQDAITKVGSNIPKCDEWCDTKKIEVTDITNPYTVLDDGSGYDSDWLLACIDMGMDTGKSYDQVKKVCKRIEEIGNAPYYVEVEVALEATLVVTCESRECMFESDSEACQQEGSTVLELFESSREMDR